MKTISKLFIALLVMAANFSFAQIPYRSSMYHPDVDIWNMQSHQKNFFKSNPLNRASYNLTMDYGIADNDSAGYRWQFSSSYTAADTALNYCAVTFDEIAGYLDETDPYGSIATWSLMGLPSKYPSNLVLVIDSVFFLGGHENNSGNQDIFNLQLVTAGATGEPSTNVVWEWTDSTDQSISSSGEWLGANSTFVMGEEVAYTTSPGQKMSIVLNYYDPSKLDTFGVNARYRKNSSGDAALSAYKNSYTRYPPMIPDVVRNTNITYNIGGTNYNYEAQNWAIFITAHFDYNVGIDDNFGNLTLQKVFPSPANEEAKVKIDLKNNSNVKIDVLNLEGKTVATLFEGNLTAGQHLQRINTADLATGMYLVSVKAGEGSPVISKLAVTH